MKSETIAPSRCKFRVSSSFRIPNSNLGFNQNMPEKVYDLEERTLAFAKAVRELVKELPKCTANFEDGKQVVRSSGSVGANCIEANESLGKKDFAMRIRISLKEAKETVYWLKLVDCENNKAMNEKRTALIQEATELMKIFGAILKKTTGAN